MGTDLVMKATGADPEACEVVATTDDRRAWLAARRPLLGASEIASVLGLSPWTPAIEVWARKTSKVEEAEDDVSEPMELGQELEPWLLSALRSRSGCEVRPTGVLLRSRQWPWLGATQDGAIVAEPGTPLGRSVPAHVGRVGTVEVKSAGGGFAEQWSTDHGYRDVALVPAWYLPQVDAQLAVTGAPFAVFGALLGGRGFRFRWTVVERNEARIAELVEATRLWWEAHVVRDVPPDPDGSEAASDLLARLYPDQGGIVTLPDASAEDVRVMQECKLQIAELEKVREQAKQRLQLAIGGAAVGELPDGRRVEYRTVQRKGYTVQASEYRQLRLPK